ncbi:MAG: glycoside hydrolase family 13 protein [Actinomyces urogenitalis]|uniref:glycoside hydrolase family 13 protein n=1 Tax=Actinomyces urogenitalis TaxID=103621 RepID=UPI002A81B3D9|nr:glycoside hydrolase family 13 protein [Actinomyces urogenitalis]MDY3679552.1 glycoside hydrolase family 13 protein [Actinomyces urogenitalis]
MTIPNQTPVVRPPLPEYRPRYDLSGITCSAQQLTGATALVPTWLEDAVFYQVFPERFCNADPSNDPPGTLPWGGTPTRENFFGGDLQGITAHLDHIAAVGANTLYLTPVFTAGTNHRYDGEDYFAIDPALGGDSAFDELVEAVHARGMRLVLDGVFNHCGWHHPYFEDVVAHGAQSAYVNWFLVEDFPVSTRPSPNYETCSGCEYLPKWNVHNPQVRQHHLDVVLYWLERGIDGWRLDVPYYVHDGFWRRMRRTVKERYPEACLIGEEWGRPTRWLHGDMFDGTMNYGVRDLALAFAASRRADAGQTARQILDLQEAIPPHSRSAMMNLLGSHDTARLLQECGGSVGAVCQALALLIAFPGAPMIYYGDEIGLTGENDPGCRACMPWDETRWDRDLLEATRSFVAVRQESSSLGRGPIEVVLAVGDVLILRSRGEGSSTLTLINRGSGATCVPAELVCHAGRDLVNLVDGRRAQTVQEDRDGWLSLPGYSVRMIEENR